MDTKKSNFYLVIVVIAIFVCGFVSCKDKDKTYEPCRVYGIVTDETGEPIQGAIVMLNGDSTVTNDNGQYEFVNLMIEGYWIIEVRVIACGVLIQTPVSVFLSSGQSTKCDVQVVKYCDFYLGSSDLYFLVDIDGVIETDTIQSFWIANNCEKFVVEWRITSNTEWISNICETSGTLNECEWKEIFITIDRNKLSNFENIDTAIVHINSNMGNHELRVIATTFRW